MPPFQPASEMSWTASHNGIAHVHTVMAARKQPGISGHFAPGGGLAMVRLRPSRYGVAAARSFLVMRLGTAGPRVEVAEMP